MLLNFSDLTPKGCVNAEKKKNLSLEGCTFSLGLVFASQQSEGPVRLLEG